MGSNRQQSHTQSGKIAFCGMLVALSVMLMLSGGLIPIATYCSPMLCALLLLPIMIEFGRKTAWIAFAAVALITLFIGIDKEAAAFYLFIGYYPLIKWDIDRIKNKPVRLLVKLILFNVSIALMYILLGFVLNMTAVVAEFSEMGTVMLIIFAVLLDFAMLLYDRLLFPLMILYVKKLQPKLRFLKR